MFGLTTNARYDSLQKQFAAFKANIAPLLGDVSAKKAELEDQRAQTVTNIEDAHQTVRALMAFIEAGTDHVERLDDVIAAASEMEKHQADLAPVVIPANLAAAVSAAKTEEDEEEG